jgi:hypothetical protein
LDHNAPTIKPNKGVRFYNPGDRISEPILYSVEGADIHTVARFTLDIEERGFANVPTEIKMLDTGQRIPVNFPTTVCDRFKDRGLVLIDEEHVATEDEEEEDKVPIAVDEDAAKDKGDRIWRKYLFGIVRRHTTLCNEIRRNNGVPEEASGFTRRALKLLNMKDPASAGMEAVDQAVSGQTKAVDPRIASLEEQNAATQELVKQLLAKLSAKDEVQTAAKVEEAAARASAKTRKN